MKITVLAYLDREDGEIADIVVGQAAAALRKAGHRVSVFGVHAEPRKLISGLMRRRPELVFNLLTRVGDHLLGAVPVVGALDLLGLPYTGAGPGENYLQDDHALTRKLLAFDRIACPAFAMVAHDADLQAAVKLRMPLSVKPTRMDSTSGTGAGALVYTTRELKERILEIHQKAHDIALVEEHIDGRDFYVGVLGNQSPVAFPPLEVDSTKWNERSAECRATRAVVADVPDQLRAGLHTVALDAYCALRVRDYGRLDLRVTETGDIYVIGVNASCCLEQSSEYATAAAAQGMDYPALVGRIAELAMERHQRRRPTQRQPAQLAQQARPQTPSFTT